MRNGHYDKDNQRNDSRNPEKMERETEPGEQQDGKNKKSEQKHQISLSRRYLIADSRISILSAAKPRSVLHCGCNPPRSHFPHAVLTGPGQQS
jgi:hypothetical protein